MSALTRPGHDEADAYSFKYVDLVPEGDLLAQLERQARELDALLGALPPEAARHRYALGKWSLQQVLQHLSDCERLFAFRAFWFARGFTSELPSFDQELSDAAAQADALPWRAQLEEFRAVRAASLALYRALPDTAWERRGVASGKGFSVRALAYLSAGHVTHHLALVRERYL